MTVGPRTHRLTVNLPTDIAAGVEQIAQARGLSSSVLAAQLLAAAVRSLKPQQESAP